MVTIPQTPSAGDQPDQACFCIGTDHDALHAWLDRDLRARGLATPVLQTHPHLFAAAPVFVAQAQVQAMLAVIEAIESVFALPAVQAAVLTDAPAIARPVPAAQGILQGYDFHLTDAGPKLIEINTNAGGALLNLELIRAQRACCDEVAALITGPNEASSEARLLEMFLAEWRRARGDAPLRRIAIVDAAPESQYLYPEFLLFQRLFESHGIAAVILAPEQLRFEGSARPGAAPGQSPGELYCDAGPVDLVYNRLTDFYLEAPESAALRDAYRAGAVVTPNPHEHALHASKANLALLTDTGRLASLGVDAATIETLIAGIPHTELVRAEHADRLWAARDDLFFKPVAGFGSRGSYRGAKLTRKVFAQIIEGASARHSPENASSGAAAYVAQALVPPGVRLLDAQQQTALKFDIRVYAHRGAMMLIAARLYQGQTTNFRTPGGGFAPVWHPPGPGVCP